MRRYGFILIGILMVLGFELALTSTITRAEEGSGFAFLKAIYTKDFALMDKLTAEGVNVNAPIRSDLPPLAEAASAGDLEVVDYLLRKGAKVEGTDKLPNSPIYFAISEGNIAVVKRFLDLGISSNYTWPPRKDSGGTLLTVAVDSGRLEMVELLVQRGADVNSRGSANYGALYRSVFNDYYDIFKFLLSKGACLSDREKAVLAEWDKNELNEKYIELLGKKKGCNDLSLRTKH